MMKMPKIHIKNLSLEELTELCSDSGEKSFRAKQIFRHLYAQKTEDFSQMLDLPAAFRTYLAEIAEINSVQIEAVQHSEDGTLKFLFRLEDDCAIESVLIPSEIRSENGDSQRLTLCVSTQVGCPLACKFCATASLKLKRNLTAAEIVDQLLQAQKFTGKKITNLVFMGMGEPMLNYDNVMKAVDIFTNPDADLLSARRITISTSGLVEEIKKMADENRQIKLAISLHATTDALRTKLMPINKKYNLRELGDAVEYYYRKIHKPITYEYILFDGLNDTKTDAERLAKITRRVPSKVNVIPFHTIEFTQPEGFSAELRPTSKEKFENFILLLRALEVTVMIRSSSGEDIDAACGQLAFSTVAKA